MSTQLPAGSQESPYRGVLFALAAAAAVAAILLMAGGVLLGNSVLLHACVSLAVAAGSLLGVVWTHAAQNEPDRLAPRPIVHRVSIFVGRVTALSRRFRRAGPPEPEASSEVPSNVVMEEAPRSGKSRRIAVSLSVLIAFGTLVFTGLVGAPEYQPTTWVTALAVGGCLAEAALSAMATRYLTQLDAGALPESAALARGGRVVMWLFVVAALSIAIQWSGLSATASVLSAMTFAIIALNVAAGYALMTTPVSVLSHVSGFDVDFTFTRVLGSRANIFASVMDSMQAQLGIDLRSTWALEVVRHALEPLVMGLALAGWLTTSFTIVAVNEQGLVERLGVPHGSPLEPGLHLHLPWPIDRVYRISVQRVQRLSVGHEGEEEGGPEDVLWAVEHAKNEYTLLLGNGRDLITIDAGVQFRIVDARAWFYGSQNPADALKAIAYRAVMRNTVNRTLADALSENIVATTARMRAMVQADADALGLGVRVVDFTVGGMHPPVPVAGDYEAVVSAELGKVTAVVNAQAVRNRTVPYAESEVQVGANSARADGAANLAQAAGDAWAFRTLEAQYRASPGEYMFRERLDALERALGNRRFTILDQRIQRDRGELWITP